ncbi:hypothetical protein AVEN_195076-1 [Araneus ventricosus]|uniref:Uncharacterized protein n=1 Tax=Araneus ventricosus TaxID=182803 RepID=A0A4Y2BGJ7_ARAVE|nr:hypothetical protein AVEN_195076-1 [Araneus ventricosus]
MIPSTNRRLVHVKSVGAKCSPAGTVRKFGDGGCWLRCRHSHLTSVQNCKVRSKIALVLLRNETYSIPHIALIWLLVILFPQLKEYLSGARFSSDDEVVMCASKWLNEQGNDFYQAGVSKLVLRSEKRLNRFSDYVEIDMLV